MLNTCFLKGGTNLKAFSNTIPYLQLIVAKPTFQKIGVHLKKQLCLFGSQTRPTSYMADELAHRSKCKSLSS